ncbi:MAG: hypothetical protein BIFFINMI_02793 [Phycisphaerae bacterium]|nr:hypothetical protein [Phycisphaerae bacterium]
MTRRRPGKALTLVETMFSVLIMGTVIVMAMNSFGSLVKSRATTNAALQATSLAEQLLSEIVQNAYADPTSPGSTGREGSESTRASFDDVDDYNNWTESPLTLRDATVIAGTTGWTRQATVQYLDPDTLAVSGSDGGLKRIMVTVTDPRGVTTSVSALRSRCGAYDQSPSATTTAVRWIGVELQLGGDTSTRMFSGTSIPAIVPSGQ